VEKETGGGENGHYSERETEKILTFMNPRVKKERKSQVKDPLAGRGWDSDRPEKKIVGGETGLPSTPTSQEQATGKNASPQRPGGPTIKEKPRGKPNQTTYERRIGKKESLLPIRKGLN